MCVRIIRFFVRHTPHILHDTWPTLILPSNLSDAGREMRSELEAWLAGSPLLFWTNLVNSTSDCWLGSFIVGRFGMIMFVLCLFVCLFFISFLAVCARFMRVRGVSVVHIPTVVEIMNKEKTTAPEISKVWNHVSDTHSESSPHRPFTQQLWGQKFEMHLYKGVVHSSNEFAHWPNVLQHFELQLEGEQDISTDESCCILRLIRSHKHVILSELGHRITINECNLINQTGWPLSAVREGVLASAREVLRCIWVRD